MRWTAFQACLLGLCAAVAACAAQAAEIHQCRPPGGVVVFQDRPCAAGQQTLSTRDIEERPPPAAANAAARAERRRIEAWERRSQERLAPSLGGRGVAPARTAAPARAAGVAPPDACANARRAREDAYRRDGNRMDFDRRRALQDAVTAACGLR